ncbi:hypothetical protein Taro_002008 [Colocasia esculenta]|uniref:Uncharacterized protein n=1 Tax=Colocasia esculenta TaxID=4460 RepID=A0A843TG26_COLES|nr:hypothetical protein [Colocasia esculenta]
MKTSRELLGTAQGELHQASRSVWTMASRGRRGGAPAREDEPRRDERAEQQAPAPQGPVLPPPLPVDYGVFMQGLVQAMQTQAHTPAALQAQLEAQFWLKASLASTSMDVCVVSASTMWTPTLNPASSDVDVNFTGLHALQSRKSREQATPTIGELSPTTHYLLRRTGVVGDDTLAEEAVETDSERGD